jgi:hypothetical protein
MLNTVQNAQILLNKSGVLNLLLCNLAKAHTTDVMVFKYVDSEKSAN